MERNPINKSSEEEIDLVYYFEKFRNGLRYFTEWFGRYLKVLWRNFFLFLFISLLGATLALSLRYIIEPAFQTKALFVSRYLPASYYQLMVHNLNQLLNKEDLETVAVQLNVPKDVAAEIIRMELKPLGDSVLNRNHTLLSPFEITLLVRDMNDIANIQDGLLLYLEGGKIAVEEKIQEKKSLDSVKQVLYSRLIADSVQAFRGNLNLKSSAGEQDLPPGPSAIYQEYMAVARMIDELDKIKVIQAFLKKSSYNYPDYNRYLITGILISLLCAMILTPMLGRRR